MRGKSGGQIPESTATLVKARGYALPPVAEIGISALVLVVIGGVYLSANYPRSSSLLFPAILAIASALLLIFNVFALIRSRGLAREIFFKVGKWALLAYLIVAGMLEYVFIYDGARGTDLALVSVMLIIFALDVPTIIAFTVARYHNTSAGANF